MRNFRWLVVPPLSRGMTVACVAAAVAFGQAAHAQSDYPNRPITLVLPLGAGGAMDILARGQFAPKLSERLGKPIVVENRTGGGTVIAATSVAKHPPTDTRCSSCRPARSHQRDALQEPALRPRQGFRADRTDLEARLRAVGASLDAGEVHPRAGGLRQGTAGGNCPNGSTGIGATPHLAVEMFQRAAGLQIGLLTCLIAGCRRRPTTWWPATPKWCSPIRRWRSRSRLTTSCARSRCRALERIPAVPAVPSLHELGFKDFEAVSWHMIVAPAGTPKPVVDRLHAEFKAIVASPEFQQQALKMGLNAIDSPPPEALKRYLDAEILRWGELVKQVGIAGTAVNRGPYRVPGRVSGGSRRFGRLSLCLLTRPSLHRRRYIGALHQCLGFHCGRGELRG